MPFFLSLFLFCFFTTYSLRHLFAFHRKLVLRDYRVILITSLIALFFSKISALLFIFLFGLFLIQWIHGILFGVFRIKLNLPTLKIFFTGVGHFAEEFKALLPSFKAEPKWLLLFILGLLGTLSLSFFQSLLSYVFIAWGIFFLTLITKSKLTLRTSPLWIVILGVLEYFLAPHLYFPKEISANLIYFAIGLVIVLSLLSFLIKTKKQFWVLPSFLADEWREDKLVYSTVNTVPEFMKGAEGLLLYSPPEEGWLPKADGVVDSSATPHQKIQPPRPSGTPPLEGNIKTPIILITVESLSGFYLKKNALQMPYFQSLAKKGLQSTCHIAPCSLTNNAFRHIYQHSYVKSDFSYLRQLKNYQPIFVTSQKSTEFNLDALLHTIGFEVILDNVSLSQKTSARLSDPEFFERIPALIQEKLDTTRAPFIHIMNNQTHGPYFTYSEKIVDRQKRYEKAIEETDTTLQKLMPSLSAFIDMDNALIIFTGDHGESFGEESYLSHANAIIQPQIEVPLAIYHRNITPHTISLSNHFDLFPTIAEILSLDLPLSMLGQSLLQGKSTGCLVHSETRFGNTPSSFGYVGENKKWHIDRLLDKYELRNLQDEILEQLEGKTRQELVDVLATALQDRSLVF